jgi:hypothetical protein
MDAMLKYFQDAPRNVYKILKHYNLSRSGHRDAVRDILIDQIVTTDYPGPAYRVDGISLISQMLTLSRCGF